MLFNCDFCLGVQKVYKTALLRFRTQNPCGVSVYLVGYTHTIKEGLIIYLHRRIVAAYRLRKSAALASSCFGRFRFEKTTLSCFCLATFNYAGVIFGFFSYYLAYPGNTRN